MRSKAKMKFAIVLLVLGVSLAIEAHEVIQGYHFHTYFFQDNKDHARKAQGLRDLIHREITSGILGNCSMNHLNMNPIGPHPIGSWETCCNVSSVGPGVSFFMQKRGEFSVLLHPLTTSEVIDHSERAFWLGQKMPLDLQVLSPELHHTPICPIYGNSSRFF